MVKTRVHELAAEFGVTSEQLIQSLKEMNIFVRSHLSALEAGQVSALRVRWEREKRKSAEEPKPKRGGRRKAAEPVAPVAPAAPVEPAAPEAPVAPPAAPETPAAPAEESSTPASEASETVVIEIPVEPEVIEADEIVIEAPAEPAETPAGEAPAAPHSTQN